jgi:TrmH family RNA methyltransferase
MIITSTSNSRIKDIKRLKERKFQKTSPWFYMEGFRILSEAFDHGSILQTVIWSADLLKNEYGLELLEKCRNQGIELLEVSEPVFRSISLKENPQGMAALGKKEHFTLADLAPEKGLLIALNEIADPGNLGTIIRTADAVAAQGILLLGDCVSPYDTGAVRGSMGALFSLKIVQTSFPELNRWKQSQLLPMIGTSDKAATDYATIAYPAPMILLMGSERNGLSEYQISACDQVVRIPMLRSSDSLNLAVATGIMAYQIYNSYRGLTGK